MNVSKAVSALLVLGSVFFGGGCSPRVLPQDVTVEGVGVGGMNRAAAERLILNRIAENLPPLTVHAPSGDVVLRYPDLSVKTDVRTVLKGAKQGETYTLHTERTFADTEDFCKRLCEKNAREAKDATLGFTNAGFSYGAGANGIACDAGALERDIESALKTGGTEVTLSVKEYAPSVTEEILRERTQPLSEFTTHFDADNAPRAENIRISAGRIGGSIIGAGEEFSFNGCVGLRTAENGYKIATVIQDGVFAEGIGGGVCQTSTTLFNAALLAGMEITESRSHSLSISYVPPSLDAMVSEYSDLKFKNPFDTPVYISSKVEVDGITFSFFGLPSGVRYDTESVTVSVTDPPPVKYIEGSEEKLVRAQKRGITSESYLLTYGSDGALLSRKLIRRDSYAAVQGIYQIVFE